MFSWKKFCGMSGSVLSNSVTVRMPSKKLRAFSGTSKPPPAQQHEQARQRVDGLLDDVDGP